MAVDGHPCGNGAVLAAQMKQTATPGRINRHDRSLAYTGARHP
jgi:hypothetical protein